MDVHESMQELAEPFVRGTLSEEEDAAVAAHAEECADCAAVLRDVQDRCRARESRWRSPVLRRAAKTFASASAVVGLVVLGMFFQDGGCAPPVLEAQTEACLMPPRPRMEPQVQADLAFKKALDAGVEDSRVGAGGGRVFKRYGGVVAEGKRPIPFVDDRKIVRNAELLLEVDAFDAAQDLVIGIAGSENGFIAGVETQKQANGKTSGTLTVRVPSDRFDVVLPRLRELGMVRHQNVQTQDVTKTYVDLAARLGAKQALVERLKKVLAEAQGGVKELMEVEVQLGRAVEEIEGIKGEIKYYDNVVGLSTIVLRMSEKDLAQPFEYVETLRANIGLSVRDAEDAYARTQKVLAEAGGQMLEAQLARESDGSARGTVRAHVDAEKFPQVREGILGLGHVTKDTVSRQRLAQGGAAGAGPAPVKAERAVVDVLIATATPQVTRRTRLALESDDVESLYQAARKACVEAGAKLTGGSLNAQADGASAGLSGVLDVEKAASLLERLGRLGKTKSSETKHSLPTSDAAAWERAEITLSIATPPPLIGEEHGVMRVIRETFSGSVAGLLWSVEKLFVGLSLAGPWALLAGGAYGIYRRARKRKEARAQAAG